MVRDARKGALLTMKEENGAPREKHPTPLILRSGPFGRVSKDGRKCRGRQR
jgi:hypothetical protein